MLPTPKPKVILTYRELGGYKYDVRVLIRVPIPFLSHMTRKVDSRFLSVKKGILTIKKGYAWDGPSGPTFDTKTFMRGSLVHDALYQLIREGEISILRRDDADKLLRTICLEDGMSKFRAWYVYHALRLFGRGGSLPRAKPRGEIVNIYKRKTDG